MEDGDFKPILIFLVPHPLSTTESSTGGVAVESSSLVRLYDDFYKIFALAEAFALNKFTRLKFNVECPASDVSICFYEDVTDISRNTKKQCHTVEAGGSQNVDIRAGALLDDKKSNISYIAIVQKRESLVEDTEAYIATISISPGENTDIVDENGHCKDTNAETLSVGNKIICRCTAGFVSSNGGKIQTKLDSCVPCLVSTFCSFEGDACISGEDCFWNSCVNGICKSIWVSCRKRTIFILCTRSFLTMIIFSLSK